MIQFFFGHIRMIRVNKTWCCSPPTPAPRPAPAAPAPTSNINNQQASTTVQIQYQIKSKATSTLVFWKVGIFQFEGINNPYSIFLSCGFLKTNSHEKKHVICSIRKYLIISAIVITIWMLQNWKMKSENFQCSISPEFPAWKLFNSTKVAMTDKVQSSIGKGTRKNNASYLHLLFEFICQQQKSLLCRCFFCFCSCGVLWLVFVAHVSHANQRLWSCLLCSSATIP